MPDVQRKSNAMRNGNVKRKNENGTRWRRRSWMCSLRCKRGVLFILKMGTMVEMRNENEHWSFKLQECRVSIEY